MMGSLTTFHCQSAADSAGPVVKEFWKSVSMAKLLARV